MRSVQVTFLSLQLNRLLDSGYALDLAETKRRITDGTVFDWLRSRFKGDIDLSLLNDHPGEKGELLEFFRGLVETADEDRRMGVRHNGLALLVAYCIEWIQQE